MPSVRDVWNVIKNVVGIGKALTESEKLNAPLGSSKAQQAIDAANAKAQEKKRDGNK